MKKKWKQSKCPSVKEWLMKVWSCSFHIHFSLNTVVQPEECQLCERFLQDLPMHCSSKVPAINATTTSLLSCCLSSLHCIMP